MAPGPARAGAGFDVATGRLARRGGRLRCVHRPMCARLRWTARSRHLRRVRGRRAAAPRTSPCVPGQSRRARGPRACLRPLRGRGRVWSGRRARRSLLSCPGARCLHGGLRVSRNAPTRCDRKARSAHDLSPHRGAPSLPRHDLGPHGGAPSLPRHDLRPHGGAPSLPRHDLRPHGGTPSAPRHDLRPPRRTPSLPRHDLRPHRGTPSAPRHDLRPPRRTPSPPRHDLRPRGGTPSPPRHDPPSSAPHAFPSAPSAPGHALSLRADPDP
jgi:hypothetical protein